MLENSKEFILKQMKIFVEVEDLEMQFEPVKYAAQILKGDLNPFII